MLSFRRKGSKSYPFHWILFFIIATLPFAQASESPKNVSSNSPRQLHILVTCYPNSHAVPILSIAQALVDHGHRVTLAMEKKSMQSMPESDLIKHMSIPIAHIGDNVNIGLFSKVPDVLIPILYNMILFIYGVDRKLYNHLIEEIGNMTVEDRPDAFLVDYFVMDAFDAADKLGIPSINNQLLGSEFYTPKVPSPFPKFSLPFSVNSMTLFQSFVNLAYQYTGAHLIGIKIFGLERWWKRGLPFVSTFESLHSKRLTLMIGAPGFNVPESMPSDQYVYVGAPESANVRLMTATVPDYGKIDKNGKASPKTVSDSNLTTSEWLDEMNEKNVPVIYIAFGSIVEASEKEMFEFAKALASSRWKVLWSLRKSTLNKFRQFLTLETNETSILDNFRIENWVAQKDVLAHPATKVFLTHAGINSVMESALAGKPLVCRPYFGDQPYNCQRLVDLGVAESFNRRNFSSDDISSAFNKIFDRYSYYEKNAKYLGELFRRPGGSKRAVEAIEDFVERGLWLSKSNLPFLQRYLPTIVSFLQNIIYLGGAAFLTYRWATKRARTVKLTPNEKLKKL